MALLDPDSLDTETPRTLDGRSYPDHLRPFAAYDGQLLHLLSEIEPATFDELSVKVEDPKVRAVLSRWIASAEWRGLIERRDPTHSSPRKYVLSARGKARPTAELRAS
jgi:hypothetical protein